MLTVAAFVALFLFLSYLIFPVTFRSLTRPFLSAGWWGGSKLPVLTYSPESSFCKELVNRCPILNERYSPPLWGYIGHFQTLLFSIFGHFKNVKAASERIEIKAEDGSIISYDLFTNKKGGVERRGESNIVYVMIPGIMNTAQSDYIQLIASHLIKRGFDVAVLNHLGCLPGETLHAPRLFTYGGTGDILLMYRDLLHRYGNDVVFVGVGFSLGGFNLLRFVTEDKDYESKFACIYSFCQGYCPAQASPYLTRWTEGRRLYNFLITRRLTHLLKKHRKMFFADSKVREETTNNKNASPCTRNGAPASKIMEDRDMDGYPLDKSLCLKPDERVWSSNSILQYDELFTRRALGFSSVINMYKCLSSYEFLHKLKSVPVILVNSLDDPIVPEELHQIPANFVTNHNFKSLFIQTHHGGHLGYYEGGLLIPNELSWTNRLILEVTPVILKMKS